MDQETSLHFLLPGFLPSLTARICTSHSVVLSFYSVILQVRPSFVFLMQRGIAEQRFQTMVKDLTQGQWAGSADKSTCHQPDSLSSSPEIQGGRGELAPKLSSDLVTSLYTYTHKYTYRYTHVHVHILFHRYKHTHTYCPTDTQIYAHTLTQMHTYTHIHKDTQTYTH